MVTEAKDGGCYSYSVYKRKASRYSKRIIKVKRVKTNKKSLTINKN